MILPPSQRRRAILHLAVPIIGGMVSQLVLNLVDMAMVGTQGDAALAAVGTGSFAQFVAVAFVTGLSAGVQAMVSRRVGEDRMGEVAVPWNGGLLVAIAVALPLTLLSLHFAPLVFPVLNPDPEVQSIGIPYLNYRLLGIVFVGINFSSRGYWNGVSQSGRYLQTLLIMHLANIVMNYGLIFGRLGMPELGAVGAGLGSVIATGIGSAYYIVLGLRFARDKGFLQGLPDPETLRTTLKLALPAGAQQLMFALGYTVLYSIFGRLGPSETAAANVVINLGMVGFLVSMALGMTAATLVGEALGRKDVEDARRWGWDVVRMAGLISLLLGIPLVVLPDPILGIFLHDPKTVALAHLPLQIFGAGLVIDAAGMVLMNALMGAGAVRQTLVVVVSAQWGFFLPLAWLLGPTLGFGLTGIWLVQLVYRGGQTLILACLWSREGWTRIKV